MATSARLSGARWLGLAASTLGGTGQSSLCGPAFHRWSPLSASRQITRSSKRMGTAGLVPAKLGREVRCPRQTIISGVSGSGKRSTARTAALLKEVTGPAPRSMASAARSMFCAAIPTSIKRVRSCGLEPDRSARSQSMQITMSAGGKPLMPGATARTTLTSGGSVTTTNRCSRLLPALGAHRAACRTAIL